MSRMRLGRVGLLMLGLVGLLRLGLVGRSYMRRLLLVVGGWRHIGFNLSFVNNLSLVTFLIHFVPDDLRAAVGEKHPVLAGGQAAVGVGLVAKIKAAVLVIDTKFVLKRHGHLK